MNWDYEGYGKILTLPTNAIYMATIARASVDWNHVTATLRNAHSYSRLLRTLNEPEQKYQANVSPEEACGLIQQYLLPLKSFGYQVLSPGVTSGSTGRDWLTKFLALGCGTTIIDMHFYGIRSKDFIDDVQSFAEFGQPLFISEFSAMDYQHNVPATSAQYEDVFHGALQECKDNSQIIGCMIFGWFADAVPGGLGNDTRLLECPNGAPDDGCGPNAHGWEYLNY